jgi:hypothetical protein
MLCFVAVPKFYIIFITDNAIECLLEPVDSYAAFTVSSFSIESSPLPFIDRYEKRWLTSYCSI